MSKSKYSNDFKSEVLAKDLLTEVVKVKKEYYYDTLVKVVDIDSGIISLASFDYRWCDYVFKNRCNPEIDCALLLMDSKRRKAKKVRDKISDLVLSGKAIFITLTFTDKILAKTSVITRRRYVARYLKANSKNYVANIDFGAKKGREHYHALVDSDIDFSNWYKYGAVKVERVRTSESDLARVSLYVSKLTNHALKVGENAPRLIYSRSTC